MLDEYYLRFVENSIIKNEQDNNSKILNSRTLYFIEILKNIENSHPENLKQMNMTENLIEIVNQINRSRNIRMTIRKINKQRVFNNESTIKKMKQKIQKFTEIFNFTCYNQNSFYSIDKFFLIFNEKKYIISAIIKDIKNQIRKKIIDRYYYFYNQERFDEIDKLFNVLSNHISIKPKKFLFNYKFPRIEKIPSKSLTMFKKKEKIIMGKKNRRTFSLDINQNNFRDKTKFKLNSNEKEKIDLNMKTHNKNKFIYIKNKNIFHSTNLNSVNFNTNKNENKNKIVIHDFNSPDKDYYTKISFKKDFWKDNMINPKNVNHIKNSKSTSEIELKYIMEKEKKSNILNQMNIDLLENSSFYNNTSDDNTHFSQIKPMNRVLPRINESNVKNNNFRNNLNTKKYFNSNNFISDNEPFEIENTVKIKKTNEINKNLNSNLDFKKKINIIDKKYNFSNAKNFESQDNVDEIEENEKTIEKFCKEYSINRSNDFNSDDNINENFKFFNNIDGNEKKYLRGNFEDFKTSNNIYRLNNLIKFHNSSMNYKIELNPKKKLFELLRSGEKIKKLKIEDLKKKIQDEICEEKSIINPELYAIKNRYSQEKNVRNHNIINHSNKIILSNYKEKKLKEKIKISLKKNKISFDKFQRNSTPKKLNEKMTTQFNNFIIRKETQNHENIKNIKENFTKIFHRKSLEDSLNLKNLPKLKIRQIIRVDE